MCPKPKGRRGQAEVFSQPPANLDLIAPLVIAQHQPAILGRKRGEAIIERAEGCLAARRLRHDRIPIESDGRRLPGRFEGDHARDASNVGSEIVTLHRRALLQLARGAIECQVGKMFRIAGAPPPVQADDAVTQFAVCNGGLVTIVREEGQESFERRRGERPA